MYSLPVFITTCYVAGLMFSEISIIMTARRLLFWIHLCAGTSAGIVILTMSLTGALLAFQPQIVQWADHAYRVAPVPNQPRLNVETLLFKVEKEKAFAPRP